MQPPGALGHVHPPATWQRKSRWVTGEADEALRVGVVSFHSAHAGGGGGGAGQVLSRPPSSLLALLFMPYLPTGWNKVLTSSAW